MTLGIITIIILSAFKDGNGKSRKFLSITLIIMVINILARLVAESNLLVQFPIAFKISNILCFLFVPLSYLYIRNLLYGLSLSTKDLVHLIPFILVLIDDSIPFWVLSHEEKINMLGIGASEMNHDAIFMQLSLIPAELVNVMYHVFFGIYFILQLGLVIKFIRRERIQRKQSTSTKLDLLFSFYPIFSFLSLFYILL
ncbi:hypothetical protein KZP23_16940 [Echinicola marina]|uniref:hypothetical protein n=1 Tax=Echinicola marina TaxID=2859768 RepID=UPI001CF6369D|nr:hypothetical protein [Echinicola marina]UCS92374.1 hypothetical protein KZP23_16940 [Echinicola marina]